MAQVTNNNNNNLCDTNNEFYINNESQNGHGNIVVSTAEFKIEQTNNLSSTNSPTRSLAKSNSLSSIIPPKFQNLSDLSRQQQQQQQQQQLQRTANSDNSKTIPPPNKFTAFFSKFSKRSEQ